MIRKLLLGIHLLAKGADGLSSDELSFLTLLKNKLWITGTTCTTVGVTCDGTLASCSFSLKTKNSFWRSEKGIEDVFDPKAKQG